MTDEESLFAICNKVFTLVLALTVRVTYNVTSHVKKTTLPFLCTIPFEFLDSGAMSEICTTGRRKGKNIFRAMDW
jgi:hypothetical protein